jgi:hypothetical protein
MAYPPVAPRSHAAYSRARSRSLGVDQAEQVLVVPQENEEAAVDDGCVTELTVRERGHCRCDRGVEHRRVTEAGIAIARGERRRDDATYAGARDFGFVRQHRRTFGMARVLFRQQSPRDVDGATRDVAVDVDAPGHDNHATCIDSRRGRGKLGNDATVVDADVSNLAIDVVRRVIHGSADDAQLAHAPGAAAVATPSP